MTGSGVPTSSARTTGWIPYAGPLVLSRGLWGAISSLPAKLCACPEKSDRGRIAAGYGLPMGGLPLGAAS